MQDPQDKKISHAMFKLSKTNWLSLTIVYMVFIAFMSLKPAVHVTPHSTVKEVVHNCLHVPAYAMMALFWYLTLRAFNFTHKVSAQNAFMFAFIFGVLMEILQGFSSGREPSLLDICSNTFGAGGMVWVIYGVIARQSRSNPKAKDEIASSLNAPRNDKKGS